MTFVDFSEVKAKVSFEHAIPLLKLTLKQQGDQWRGACPSCNSGGDRALVITKGKGFYCFASKKGGDVIALASHILQLSTRDAALHLAGNGTGTGSVPVPRNSSSNEKGALKPLDYLQAEHEAVQALSVAPQTCQFFEAGYAPKGIMRGRLAIPIHDRSGSLLAYCGRAVREESPKLVFPNGFQHTEYIFNANRIHAGELSLVKDPLEVLLAYQHTGITNTVCFLTETISSQQLERLASLLDDKQCELN